MLRINSFSLDADGALVPVTVCNMMFLVRPLVLVLASLCVVAQPLDLPTRLKTLALANQAEAAATFLESERDKQDEESSQWLLAASWVARGASFVENWPLAEKYALEAYDGATALIDRGAQIDDDENLELALGAAIEVLGQGAAAQGDRAGAIAFLANERERYRGTNVETRIQKNYLLVGLEGKPMPQVAVDRFIGKHMSLDIDGKVALFYFWAHWCSDCRAQKPILIELHDKYADQGLVVIGPTKLYGYVAKGAAATAAEEIAYIEGPWQREFPLPEWMPKPLNQENFVNFGVSTTPTLVLVDRSGVVRLYHPGRMSLPALEAVIRPLL